MATTDAPGSFGVSLRRYRAAAGLSQEELAERAGLSRRGISDLERGERRAPHPATVRRLADALGVTETDRAALLGAARSSAPETPAHLSSRASGAALDGDGYNLPLQLTSLVGREHEVAEVQRLLGTTRLLTLAGVGGIGKTRLAFAAIDALARAHPDRVAFVELASLADAALLPGAVAAKLGVREQSGRSTHDLLLDALQPRTLLLLLDNCEHIVEACAALANDLLHTCAGVRILVTSREPLRIPGELTWRVPPLRVPDPRQPSGADDLADYPAVRLFAQRALAVQPSFVLTPDNCTAVAGICSRLDGLPLAIELAAARTRVLAADQIVARLDDALRLLVGGSRLAPTRHQAVTAALDWSFQLLAPAEQLVFRRLAVFAGGWSLESAEALCADGPIERGGVLESMTGLLDKSLVHVRFSTGAARYGLLETVRQYSLQKLRGAGEEAALRERHAEWCVALAEQAFPELRGARQVLWLDRLEEEHDNLRAALRWCVEGRQAALGLRLGGALWRFWAYRGHTSEAESWLVQLLALPVTDVSARLLALMGAGTMASQSGRTSIARTRFEELRRLSIECGDWRRLAAALTQLGTIAMQENDVEAAQSLHAEALTIRQQHGFRWDTVLSLSHIAELDLRRGDCVGARRTWCEALTIARELEDVVEAAGCLRGLGEVDLAEHKLSACRTHLGEGLSLYRSVQHPQGISMMLESFAQLAHAEHRPASAMRLFGAAAKLREGFGLHMNDSRLPELVVAVRGAIGEAVAADAWAAGYAMSADQAIEEAQSPPRKD